MPDYVRDRVIFTGDAAHLLPIFGVRGANTGFQDAQNLAWKLAFVAGAWRPGRCCRATRTNASRRPARSSPRPARAPAS
ncbi:FAD-dependent monooxygenase [Marinobacterium aestuariivivens]|uniref:FAD-dependent monooxygenase n=1 Tax=Marinobacterium aestuariivivens TaxID=1698799 RepID=A0ABW1ZTV7_9GAMM